MKRKIWGAGAVAAAGLMLAMVASTAEASVIISADASRGGTVEDTFSVSGNGNCGYGSWSVVNDAQRGRVWRFHKPASSNRCEGRARGSYNWRNGGTYYIGWWFKLDNIRFNNSIFQWKSYPNAIQMFPWTLKMEPNNELAVRMVPADGGKSFYPWRRTIQANTWYHVVFGFRLSDQQSTGWLEFYFNGVQQRLDGSLRKPHRTLDTSNDSKFGVYGAGGTPVTMLMDNLVIATTYQEAAVGGPGGGNPPPPPPGPQPPPPPPPGPQPPPPPGNPPPPPPSGSAWAAGRTYAVGNVVTYGGRSYRCVQAHTSQPGWEPPNVPALWQPA